MSYIISGASSEIAQLVAEQLLQKVSPNELTLVSRNPVKLEDWKARGVEVREGDPSNRESLEAAYQGGKRLFLVSGTNIGQRVAENKKAIDAAKNVGIEHIIYTSVAGAHKLNPTPSAAEHILTELNLFDSGIPFAALRNQMYTEFVCTMLERAAQTGKWRHIGKHGRVAPVSRKDIAACATVIMLAPEKHDRVVYEITGTDRFTFPELAKLGSKIFETDIEYIPISPEEMYSRYEKKGWLRHANAELPAPLCFGSDELVHQWIAVEAGFQDLVSAHVEIITGRQPLGVESELKAFVARHQE
jgi:NAD(P)H dehydrogenase (quinone)